MNSTIWQHTEKGPALLHIKALKVKRQILLFEEAVCFKVDETKSKRFTASECIKKVCYTFKNCPVSSHNMGVVRPVGLCNASDVIWKKCFGMYESTNVE